MTEQPAARRMPIAVGLAIVLLTLVAVGSALMLLYLLYIAFIAERSVRPEETFFVFFSPLFALIGFAIVSGLLRRAYWALNAARTLIGILSLLGIYSVVTGGDIFGAGLFILTAALVVWLFSDDTKAQFNPHAADPIARSSSKRRGRSRRRRAGSQRMS